MCGITWLVYFAYVFHDGNRGAVWWRVFPTNRGVKSIQAGVWNAENETGRANFAAVLWKKIEHGLDWNGFLFGHDSVINALTFPTGSRAGYDIRRFGYVEKHGSRYEWGNLFLLLLAAAPCTCICVVRIRANYVYMVQEVDRQVPLMDEIDTKVRNVVVETFPIALWLDFVVVYQITLLPLCRWTRLLLILRILMSGSRTPSTRYYAEKLWNLWTFSCLWFFYKTKMIFFFSYFSFGPAEISVLILFCLL